MLFKFWNQVSWVRLSDWHILTNGVVSYTKDDRISVLYREGSFDWILQVSVFAFGLLFSNVMIADKICSAPGCWYLWMPNFCSHRNNFSESTTSCFPPRVLHLGWEQFRSVLRVPREPGVANHADLHDTSGQAGHPTTIHLLVPEPAHGELWSWACSERDHVQSPGRGGTPEDREQALHR